MPAIWNVSNISNSNNKKVSSKLTFDVGEKFSGRIVKSNGSNDVSIKLLDGWQFDAKLDDKLEDLQGDIVKFEVEGFDEGKLKLKIVSDEEKGNSNNDDVLGDFLEEEGLSKEDKILLSNMIKHNMVASKENVLKMKNIITFQNKMNNNQGEIDAFIEKYLLSKGISVGSEKANNISNILKSFFNEFSKLNEADIFMFMENNIDFTKENIDSYIKLFKEDGSLYKDIKNLSVDIKNNILNNDENKIIKENLNNKEKITNVNNGDSKKAEINPTLNKDLQDNKISESATLINNDKEINLDKNSMANVVKNIYGSSSNNKVSMLQLLKTLTSNEVDIIKNTLKDVLGNKLEFQNGSIKEKLEKINLLEDKDILNFIKNTVEETGIELNQIKKSHMEESISKYFNKNITLTDNEFHKIDQTIKYAINNNLGNEENNTNVEKAVDNKVTPKEVIDATNAENVDDNIQKSNEFKTTSVVDKSVKGLVSEITKELNSQEIVKTQIKEKSEEIKNIIKDIMNNISKEGTETADKLYQVIKNNMNDFKVFNTISNEYYYMALPLNIKEEEYPCKLIVKDDRKQGKKIDSSNVKMVVTVETKRIGMVDAYLTVKDKSIDVDIKSENEFVRILDLGKSKLEDALKGLGFNPHIHVSKKVIKTDLTNCREFFNDNSILAIDRKV
ncbi:hypothetical protein SAMN02745163_03283 [Clostridium cavendishii DSM 21758]|uniref:Hook-length control protein FliK n=1 Tax=Clostridium cavendishii DSM 21758 TaxID=1121302 RepID=A0A1M6Q470_9CLOT|nr:hypothetical protein [Clostridium cavendishii]SHK15039.1 hypothetical protein SAMN02745163_03283 [Clostridium cavendishii DSM 21758]